MAYVAGLYTKASQASADEAKRFRDFQTQIDEMGARERAGLVRQQVAQMDQYTAGLTPRSEVAFPDYTAPSAPPAAEPYKAKTGGGADSGAAASSSYERDRLTQERKLVETQYKTEVDAQKSYIDTLGRRKYVLEQQLKVAPPGMQQRIRDEIDTLNAGIAQNLTRARERVTTYNTLFEKLDKDIRDVDKGAALMSGSLPAAPGSYPVSDWFKAEPPLSSLGVKAQPIPVPDSLEMVPEPPAAQPGAAATTTPPPAQVAPDSQAFIASLTPAQFEALPKDKQDAVLAAVNRERQANRDRANFATVPAAASDIMARPINALAYMFNWASDAGDLPRYARAIGLGDVTSIQLPYLGADPTATSTPYSDLVYRLREASQPLTREQFLENLKANEQQTSVQEGKGDMQAAPAAPGVTPPTTPEAAAATTPALNMTPDVAIGDPADPRVAAITQYSAKSVADRAPKLVANVGTVVTSERGQEIINRAKALGVDPAAAIAIYGVETSFGAKGGNNKAGAGGPLQVMASDWPDFQKWFNDPANRKRYGITDTMVAAANAANYDSIDAGLLRIKYNELVGVDKNLWGAAYQASAEKVRQAGGPLPVHDAGKEGTQGLTNSDYNKLYVEVYNEARQYVNIPPTTATKQKGVGDSRPLREIEAAQTQLMDDYRYTLDVIDQEQQRANAKRQEVLRQIEIARQFNDRAAYDTAVAELETIDTLLLDGNNKTRSAQIQTRIGFDKLNLARTDEYIRMAVMDLDAGNPDPFAEMVSRGTGMMVEIDPIEGEPPKFAVYQNNQLVSGKGYTLKQLKDQYLSPISGAYEAQRAAIDEEERKFNSEQLTADLKLARDATLEGIKASGQMESQGWKEGKEAVDDAGRVIERWYSKGDRVVRMRISPDRDEGGFMVKGRVVVEEVGGLK
jgi:hypothetical protein